MPLIETWKKILYMVAVVTLCGCSLLSHKPSTVSTTAAGKGVLAGGNYQHAIADLKAGKDDDALKLFNAVMKAHRDLAPPYINVGLIEIRKDNLDAAETALQHAATLAPKQPEIYNGLGIVYRRQGRFNEAKDAYLKAIQVSPDYANAYLNLGILNEIYLNNLGAALDHYKRYQALTGGNNDMVKKWIIDVQQRLARSKGAKK